MASVAILFAQLPTLLGMICNLLQRQITAENQAQTWVA
jgi:hypothetical protein